ncbi:MAG TPA: hypothetical protein VE338_06495 [Ktedonobacterales bacterium]|jgi:hypothetical protein|nr:hypothetical protein [Ktedonobacterales bacterium]
MSERDAPRAYGVRIGLVSGLFAIGQVAISTAAARGSEGWLRAIQQTFTTLASGGIADPTTIAPALLPMLLATYLAMLLVGLVTVWFASRAGRLAAVAQGRHAGGASAGMWVWLTSSSIWVVASIIAAALTGSDGTLSGVFFGDFSRAHLSQQLVFLLIQEIVAALVCLGFCAMAGAHGARNAPIDPATAAPQAPRPMAYPPQGAYPYAPYYPMPGYPAYPPQPGQQPYPGYPPQQPYAGYLPYPPYPTHPGYPPTGWGVAPDATRPDGAMPAPPPTPTAPQATTPVTYPPPPSYYVPQRQTPHETPASSPSPAPQPE